MGVGEITIACAQAAQASNAMQECPVPIDPEVVVMVIEHGRPPTTDWSDSMPQEHIYKVVKKEDQKQFLRSPLRMEFRIRNESENSRFTTESGFMNLMNHHRDTG